MFVILLCFCRRLKRTCTEKRMCCNLSEERFVLENLTRKKFGMKLRFSFFFSGNARTMGETPHVLQHQQAGAEEESAGSSGCAQLV